VRSNLVAPLLLSILRRSDRSQRWAARAAGIGHVALSERLRGEGRLCLATETLVAVAKAVGATEEEQELLRDLDAIDRGAIPLDTTARPEEVRAARQAILAARVNS
jgi:hypothetical protein